MSNGIRSLPRYRHGGSSSPDPEEERRRRLWQLMAEQRDARAHTISLRPDTLMGRDRANMMSHLNLHGDTTGFTQQGVQDWFQGGELEEGTEFVRQLREILQASSPVTEETRGMGRHGSTDEGYPSVLSYGKPGSNRAGFYDIQGADEISLNIPPAFAPAYARGKDDEDGRATRQPTYTEEQWEQTPEDFLRRTYGHELGHAALFEKGGTGWGVEREEMVTDNFSAVLEALRNATPSDSRRDVLNEADRLIYDYPSGYTQKALQGRDGFSDNSGEFSDPLVVDPRAKLSRERMWGGGTKSMMDLILASEQFADHPLNRGLLEKFSDKVKRGIGSLRR